MATLILQQAYRLYKPPCSGKINTSGKIKLRNLEHQQHASSCCEILSPDILIESLR